MCSLYILHTDTTSYCATVLRTESKSAITLVPVQANAPSVANDRHDFPKGVSISETRKLFKLLSNAQYPP